MHIYLETDRMILRRFTDADADLLIELDKSSGGFLGWFHLCPKADGPADEPELGMCGRSSRTGTR
jgi:hypothetical protein